MNIVFFGTSGFAVPALEKLLASTHRVMAVVTQPDRPAGRGQELHQSPVKEVALAKALHLFQPENCNEYEFIRELRALSPDVIVVVAYGQKLGNDILGMPRYYVLNIHPSLLPKHTGLHTHRRALEAGDAEHGASVHFVTEQLDGGPVAIQGRFSVKPQDNEQTLAERVMQDVELKIYPQAVAWMARGELRLAGDTVQYRGRALAAPLTLADLEPEFR